VGLALLIFLTVALGITAGYHLLVDLLFLEASRVRRRMDQEFGKAPGELSPSPLFRDLERLLPDLTQAEETAKPVASTVGRRFWSTWKTVLEQADVNLSVQTLCNVAICLGLAAGVAALWLAGPLVGMAAGMAAAVVPFVVVRWKRRLRRDKFLNQLPTAFEMMARIIRAGQSVPHALRAVADAFQDPIAAEFARCQSQLTLGLSPEVTFREMAQRSGILEMKIFVMALLIQRQAGGSLAEVLERLGGLVRARLRLRKQIRTLTAEGRLQGWTLLVLPFIVFAAMLVLNRDYAMALLDHTRLLAAMGIAMLLGMLWIRKIVNVDM
jgi:tight adherence protein B